MMDSKPIGQDSSSWGRANNGQVAQLVERRPEEPSVGGSKPWGRAKLRNCCQVGQGIGLKIRQYEFESHRFHKQLKRRYNEPSI